MLRHPAPQGTMLKSHRKRKLSVVAVLLSPAAAQEMISLEISVLKCQMKSVNFPKEDRGMQN